MKTYLNKISVTIILLTFFWSCNNDDDHQIFQETSTERLNTRETELLNNLTSQEYGWKTVYFPNNGKNGGFTLLMTFYKDGTVAMNSDIDEDTEMLTSKYEINLGSTVKLTFSTRNHIHKLNDSYYAPELEGTGYEGDNEFNYYGMEGNRLHFKTTRDEVDVYFEPTTSEDQENLVSGNRKMISNILPSPTDPVYQIIKITKDGETTLYDFKYDALRRYVKSVNFIDGKVVEKKFGVGFTPEGLIIAPTLELRDEKFTSFKWDATDRKFTASSDGAIAEITFSNAPVYVNDDYKDIGENAYSLTYMGDITDNTLSNEMNSYLFKELFDSTNEKIQNKVGNQYQMDRIALIFNQEGETDPNTSSILLGRITDDNGNIFFLTYNIAYKYEDKKVMFVYHGARNGDGAFLENELKNLIDFICSPEGFYVNNEGRFFPEYTNPAYSLTSAMDARFRMLMLGNFYSNTN